ncbi:cyclin-I2 [Nycticebus coucang]|uniref:cyclin-I2 n=1 Tax=Nycticebus coucang TaxID=9470 RepID=UPI00234C16E2|nr:cyclin-I2 [Nycticebus coucang]
MSASGDRRKGGGSSATCAPSPPPRHCRGRGLGVGRAEPAPPRGDPAAGILAAGDKKLVTSGSRPPSQPSASEGRRFRRPGGRRVEAALLPQPPLNVPLPARSRSGVSGARRPEAASLLAPSAMRPLRPRLPAAPAPPAADPQPEPQLSEPEADCTTGDWEFSRKDRLVLRHLEVVRSREARLWRGGKPQIKERLLHCVIITSLRLAVKINEEDEG